MSYPSEAADALEVFVRKRWHLTGPAHHLYSALRWLERDRLGLCKPIFAGYRDLAFEARIDVKSVKAALVELQGQGLIETKIGLPLMTARKATSVQRKTLDYLKGQCNQGEGDAHKLATALSARSFRFDGHVIQPVWTPARTGRVCSSRPNIQGKPSRVRLDGLTVGLQAGQTLVHADIRQAEPTIIKGLLGIPQDRDLYGQFMSAAGCSRDEAKTAINTLAYCRDSLACFAHWPEPAKCLLGDYVHKLHGHKRELFAASRRTRTVRTATGRPIAAEKGARLHPGRVMNWRVQGTVADIVNGACLRLLEVAGVLVPLHDAVYAILPAELTALVEASIVDVAREAGVPLAVKVQVVHPPPPVRLW